MMFFLWLIPAFYCLHTELVYGIVVLVYGIGVFMVLVYGVWCSSELYLLVLARLDVAPTQLCNCVACACGV